MTRSIRQPGRLLLATLDQRADLLESRFGLGDNRFIFGSQMIVSWHFAVETLVGPTAPPACHPRPVLRRSNRSSPNRRAPRP